MKRNEDVLKMYKEYFDVDIPNTKEFTDLKIIGIKKLKALKFTYKEIQVAFGIHYKNILKFGSRETNKDLELLFDTYVTNKIYPIKTKNKLTWKQQA